MAIAGELLEDVQSFIRNYGEPVRFRKFVRTLNSGSYDDTILLTSGTDTWASGLIQSLGFNENNFVRQGFLLRDDLKVYVDGSVDVSGTWRLGIGSANPPTGEFALAGENMIESPQVAGSVIYKKLFVRKITTGSLIGE